MTAAKLRALLGDQLVSSDGTMVQVETLQGKMLCLYFAASSSEAIVDSPIEPCMRFTGTLGGVYEALGKDDGVLEVVFVSRDINEAFFNAFRKQMPWLAIPWDAKERRSLYQDLKVEHLPTLVVFDKHGNLWSYDACNLVLHHGSRVFTDENMLQMVSLERLLSGSKLLDGALNEVLISALKGKTVGLFFSAHSNRRARSFTHKLVSVYHELKASKDDEYEVVFVSSDHDDDSFKSYFSTMPWLAVSFEDKLTRSSLITHFNVPFIPYFVIFDRDGQVITTEGCSLVAKYGANAFNSAPKDSSECSSKNGRLEHPSSDKTSQEGGTHITIFGSGVTDGMQQCSICKTSRNGWFNICRECSIGYSSQLQYGEQQHRAPLLPGLPIPGLGGRTDGKLDKPESFWSKILGQFIGPELRGTIMAGVVTALLGAVTLCCSKFG